MLVVYIRRDISVDCLHEVANSVSISGNYCPEVNSETGPGIFEYAQ